MQIDPIFLRLANEGLSSHILTTWSWMLKKHYAVLGTTLFGDAFLRDDHGAIMLLDITRGELQEVATCIEELEYDLGSAPFRPGWVMEPLIRHMIAKGVTPNADQCFAFQTPPSLGGKLQPENLLLWDLSKYHSGLSSLFRQVGGLPLGTQIVAR